MAPARRLLALAAIVLFAFLAGRFYLVNGDDGTYIALARSLTQGEYRAINLPDAPVQVQYPPLLPFMLFPLANQPPGNVGMLRLCVALWSLLGVYAVAKAARIRDPASGVLAAAIFAVSPLFGEYSTSIMTESVFVLIAYAVIVRTQEYVTDASRRMDYFLPLGLLFALLLRSAAVPLAAAVLIALARAGRWRATLITAAIVVVGMSPWWMWQSHHGSDYIRTHMLQRDIYDPSAGAISPIELLTQRAPHNAARYAGRIMADVLFPPFFRSFAPWTPIFWIKFAVSLGLTAICLFGFVRRFRQTKGTVEEWYVLLTLALLHVHPVYADRYLYPLLPSFIGYCLLVVRESARRRAAIAWGGILVIGCAVAIEAPLPPEEIAYMQAVEWIHEHTPPDATIFARKPTAVWFYTGRRALSYPGVPDPAQWPRDIDYVIRDNFTIGIHNARKYADPVLADTTRFQLIHTAPLDPEVRVYRQVR